MNKKEYLFTNEEKECIIDALLLMQVDSDTTNEGQKLCRQILAKI